MNYRAYWNTVKSRRHKVNEDRLMISEYTFMGDYTVRLLVVADGMGGLENGETASYNAVSGFLESFYSELMKAYLKTDMEKYSARHDYRGIKEAMTASAQAANRSVCRGAGRLEETGSTISAVCIVEGYAVAVNVGDSPIYYYDGQRDRLSLISRLQTEAELKAERGEYERYSIEYYEDDHRLYNYLGGYEHLEEKDICTYPIGRIRTGDAILIGSDGAFGRISEDTIRMELSESLDDGEDAERFFLDNLFEMARADKDDDQTAVLYVIAEEEEEE